MLMKTASFYRVDKFLTPEPANRFMIKSPHTGFLHTAYYHPVGTFIVAEFGYTRAGNIPSEFSAGN
ncbi:MAG: hypothetical protein WEC12_05710 [Balneolaceae bacterium]